LKFIKKILKNLRGIGDFSLKIFAYTRGTNPPHSQFYVSMSGELTHMRIFRDKRRIKHRKPFSFGVGAEGCNLTYIFK
jgi:hypothetical protein